MMRKNIKTGLIAFGMCLALPFCSFAAVKNPEKAEGREERAQIRTELASYREVLDSNTKELIQAGDADGAKADLEESISIQENQIELQKSVIEQLNQKLDLLKSVEA